SRRRHTRFSRDWSSDVCSSDLGGRPHAEAMALAAAGPAARGATAYVTLEPCAHASPRGPCCTDTLIEAGVSRVVVAVQDPDPRKIGRASCREGGERRGVVAAAR